MKKIVLIFCFVLPFSIFKAQELYPINDAASSVPKGVFGIKVMYDTFYEVQLLRNQFTLRLMYGLTPKLTVWVQPMLSNHHGKQLPKDIINHRHVGLVTIPYTQSIQYGNKYPYLFGGVHTYARYRLLTFDQDNQHLRLALYGEYTFAGLNAHDEAEADLEGDSGGYGGGFIMTYLKNRWALSLRGGYIHPFDFQEKETKTLYHLTYSDAITYSLSFGYLLYPKKYNSYDQNNINLYVELMGKSYGSAVLESVDGIIEVESEALSGGAYVDLYFGVQRIVRSNDRMELSVGFNLIDKSYRHFYPVFKLGMQRYLYSKK